MIHDHYHCKETLKGCFEMGFKGMKNKRYFDQRGLTLYYSSKKTKHIRYDSRLQFVMIYYTHKTKYRSHEYK
jgi:hypothetical protein